MRGLPPSPNDVPGFSSNGIRRHRLKKGNFNNSQRRLGFKIWGPGLLGVARHKAEVTGS